MILFDAVPPLQNAPTSEVLQLLHWSTRFFLHGVFQLILGNLGALNPNLVLVFAYHVTFLRYEVIIF